MPLPHDRLTKLIAEDELIGQLEYEIARARRYSWELGLVLLEPSLPEGSHDMKYPALKFLAASCNAVMRVVDRGIRCGSGIFYILPETPPQGARVAAEKIKMEFEKADVTHPTTGDPIRCGLRCSIYVYSGAKAKEDPGAELQPKQILAKLKEELKSAP